MSNSTLRQVLPDRHFGHICLNCKAEDFAGRRYSCWICLDYQLCGSCYDADCTPRSPHHKYYHPLDVHYTSSEFKLYFGGEQDLRDNIPQSYNCAICYEDGYGNAEELYYHLNSSHVDHVDYEDYSAILIRRRAIEASVSDLLIPPRREGEGGAEIENVACSIVDVTDQVQMIQGVPPVVPPLNVGTSSTEASARSQPSDLNTDDKDVSLFYLEILPIALDTEHQYKHLAKQAVKLIEEMDLLHVGEPEYIKRSLHMLMKACGLRRELQKLPLDRQSLIGMQAANTEAFLNIIESEINDNFARERQFQNRQQNQESTSTSNPPRPAPSTSVLSRRNGLAPGSLAAAAATTLAIANASANDITIGGSINRDLNLLLNLQRIEPPGSGGGRRHRRSNGAAGPPPPPPPIVLPRRNRDNTHNGMRVTLDQLFPNSGLRPPSVSSINLMPPPLRNIPQVAPRPKPVPNKTPNHFLNLVNDIVGINPTGRSMYVKSKDKPLQPIEDDLMPCTNQYSFLCAKFKPENHNPLKLSNQRNFIESILCSMLADKKLSQLSNGINPIDNNLQNISTSNKSPFKSEINEQPTINFSGIKPDLMYRFYDALDKYKEWQAECQDQLATENIEKAAAPAPNPGRDVENPHNGINIPLPSISNEQSAHELGSPSFFIYDSGDEVENDNDNEDGDELQDDSNIDLNNQSSGLSFSLNESIDVEDEEGAEGEEETNESTEDEWEDYEDNESETDLSDGAFHPAYIY